MYRHPNLKEYIMARLVTLVVAITLLFSILFLLFIPQTEVALSAIALFVLGFSLFIYAIGRGAERMQKELNIINKYLAKMDQIDSIDYEAHFFTQEFEDINENLIKVLKGARKREDIKQHYNAKLKLKNRQRADMISAIAHEFRNPIASIMGYAQTLRDDPEIPKPLQEKFLGKIYNNGNKIEALLARLVLWNKFESGEATLHLSTFDIYALAHEVKISLKEKYPNREITVNGESQTIKADRTLMEVVLKNLIENALKYSKEEVIVEVSIDHVSVIDKGVGISTEDIDKVTKKFYRSGTHSWDNSMGLGLSIVKTILSLHHSKLEIKSTEGEGSAFSFYF